MSTMRSMKRDRLKAMGLLKKAHFASTTKLIAVSTDEIDKERDIRKHPENYCVDCRRKRLPGEEWTQFGKDFLCTTCESNAKAEEAKRQTIVPTLPEVEKESEGEAQEHHSGCGCGKCLSEFYNNPDRKENG